MVLSLATLLLVTMLTQLNYISLTYLHIHIYLITLLPPFLFLKKYTRVIYLIYLNFYWIFFSCNIIFFIDIWWLNSFNLVFNYFFVNFYIFNIF